MVLVVAVAARGYGAHLVGGIVIFVIIIIVVVVVVVWQTPRALGHRSRWYDGGRGGSRRWGGGARSRYRGTAEVGGHLDFSGDGAVDPRLAGQILREG